MNRRASVLAPLLLSGLFGAAHAGSQCAAPEISKQSLLFSLEDGSGCFSGPEVLAMAAAARDYDFIDDLNPAAAIDLGRIGDEWTMRWSAAGRDEHWNLGDRLTGIYEHGNTARDWAVYVHRLDDGGDSTFEGQSDPSPVPLPAGIWLFASALGASAWALRCRTATQM